jgi:hypothetical protein
VFSELSRGFDEWLKKGQPKILATCIRNSITTFQVDQQDSMAEFRGTVPLVLLRLNDLGLAERSFDPRTNQLKIRLEEAHKVLSWTLLSSDNKSSKRLTV